MQMRTLEGSRLCQHINQCFIVVHPLISKRHVRLNFRGRIPLTLILLPSGYLRCDSIAHRNPCYLWGKVLPPNLSQKKSCEKVRTLPPAMITACCVTGVISGCSPFASAPQIVPTLFGFLILTLSFHPCFVILDSCASVGSC